MDIFEKCFGWDAAKVAKEQGWYPYFQPIEESFGTEVIVHGRRVIMAGSNNYLGLTFDPRVKKAAIEATEKFGTSCSGSRFLNGTLSMHEELEQRLAAFLRKDAAIVFSTGFQTNQGTLAPLLTRNTVAICDKGNHASLVDGVRLGMGELKRFRHGDVADLERVLGQVDEDAAKIIIVDGVFSMEGDTADLPKIVELKKKFQTRLMVDDAHGVGVMGEHGRGTAEHYGVEDDVDLVMGTFSKSFASLGGVIAGPKDVIDYIKHHSRALIFSASMTPAAVAACMASLEIIEKEPEHRERLWHNADKMRAGFQAMGLDTGHSDTPVVPIIVGDDMKTFMFWQKLMEDGVFTNPVISPAVAPGQQLIRTSYMATHTEEQLDRALAIFEKVATEVGLIGPHANAAAS